MGTIAAELGKLLDCDTEEVVETQSRSGIFGFA